MKFSVAVIAKNEEKTLPRLLNSLKGVDEVVVCDTGSTDRTVEVARSLGAKVFENKFDIIIDKKLKEKIDELVGENDIKVGDTAFNFAKARNWAASKATHDMVFMPDCDEIVEWDLPEVEKLLDTGVDRLEYHFVFSWDNEGRPLIQFMHSKFYNRKKYKWTRFIHEVILPDTYTNQIEGWMTDTELNFLYELAKQYSTIAEIGSWKGRSTNALLEGCQGTVWAIDHFQGSADEKDKTHGGTGIYEQFLINTRKFPNLKVVKASSEEAVRQFPDKSFEMVFIDGGHTYEEVKKDIEMWMPKATKIICGHDYSDTWPEVKRAVEEKLGKLPSVDSIWYKVLSGKIPNIGLRTVFTDKIFLKHFQNQDTVRKQYLKGLAIDYIQNPYNDRNCHYFARELMYTGKHKEAIKMFERHIENPGWNTEKGQSLIFTGNCYRALGDEQKALECYARGFTHDMGRREAILALAQVKYDNKQWVEAERLYWLAVMIPKSNYYANWAPNYGHYPWGQLSVCLYNQGKVKQARDCLMKALEYDPNNETYKNNLKFFPKDSPKPLVSIIVPTLGREEKLKRCLEEIDKNASYPNYEVIVMQDSFENRKGYPKLFKEGVEKSKGELVMFLANDVIPQKDFLLLAVKKMYDAFGEAMDGLVGLNDMYWHGEFATHWLASKKLLPYLDGEFFHTGYYHLGADNELTERCRKIGKYVWAEEAKVYHDHPIQTGFKGELDEGYKIAYDEERRKHDMELLERRSKELGFELRKDFVRPDKDKNAQ